MISLLKVDTLISQSLPYELKISFLQLIALVFEKMIDYQKPESQKFTDAHLIPFLKRLIANLTDNECKTLEGSLTLFLVSKVMKIGGKEVIEKIF